MYDVHYPEFQNDAVNHTPDGFSETLWLVFVHSYQANGRKEGDPVIAYH
jgi:hypothetical protein